jgi:hypothetical protein
MTMRMRGAAPPRALRRKDELRQAMPSNARNRLRSLPYNAVRAVSWRKGWRTWVALAVFTTRCVR